MAIRNIRKNDDPCLRAKCRPVENFDARLAELLDDMYDTMKLADGVGLAAPQVGIRRRAVVIDIGEGRIELINPEFLLKEGEQLCVEGCLSFPGQWAQTKRPQHVKVRAQRRDGTSFELDAEGFLAQACCHELEHLDGIVFLDHAVRRLRPEDLESSK